MTFSPLITPVLVVAVALGLAPPPVAPPAPAPATVVHVPVSVTSPAPGRGPQTYVVKRGDTLDRIARRFKVSAATLAAANGVTNRDLVRIGQRLSIPGGDGGGSSSGVPTASASTYVVQRGDTLERIARAHGVSIDSVVRANKIRNRHVVRIGSTLSVPGASASPSTRAAGTAARYRNLPPRLRSRPERLAYIPRFEHWARTYGVSADLLMATTWLESGWQNTVVSSTGARGIGQLMPDTVTFVSGTLLKKRLDPRVPDDNIAMSARFLRYLLDQTKGDERLALSAYYQGLRSVRERGVWPGTATYASDVLSLRARFVPTR